MSKMEGRRNKSDVFNGMEGSLNEEEMGMMSKMSKRRLSFFQIIKEIRDSVSQRHNSNGGDGPSSVFYVPNEDDDEAEDDDNFGGVVSKDGLFRVDSSSSLKLRAHHAYENIGTSSGSEFGGNNESLEGKKRQKNSRTSDRNESRGGRNKFGFGSVGNLGESCEAGDHHSDCDGTASGTSHAPVGSGAKEKSKKSSRRCSASDQNLNDGFKDNDENGEEEASRMGNESENESKFGPQSLFIEERSSGGGRRKSSKERAAGNRTGANHPDRRNICSNSCTGPVGRDSSLSSKMGIISGQEINGGTGSNPSNGWQVDGKCAILSSTSSASALDAITAAPCSNRASYASSASRASTTSSESFSEIFARNLRRTFKSSQANKLKVMRTRFIFGKPVSQCCILFAVDFIT